MRFVTVCLGCMLIAGLMGCGGPPQANYGKLGLVEISGTVTLDGNPVDKAAVYFYAEDETFCFGVTDSSGHYTMMLNSEKSGVTPGEKRVEISTSSNPLGEAAEDTEEDEEEDPDAGSARATEQIPDCYNSKSSMKITISSADSDLDFQLKSDCSSTAPS